MQTLNKGDSAKAKHKDLEHRVNYILDEARMVLPGIQALLGFQLIAVFNRAFSENLSTNEQHVHLLAIFSSLCAIALLLTPAAIHRQSEPDGISKEFAGIAGRLVAAGLIPLMLSVTLDWYVVSKLIMHDSLFPLISTVVVFSGLLTLWVIWPQVRKRRNRVNVDYA